MEEKRNKSFKKPLRIALSIIVVSLFLFTLVTASVNQKSKFLNEEPIIHLNDENEFSFLQKKEVKRWLLEDRNINLTATKIEDLDLKEMEKIAASNPWVANAEIYLDNQRRLHIDITQRYPVARIFDRKGVSFYIDKSRNVMPISFGYTYPAVVFTNVPTFKSEVDEDRVMAKIAYLGNRINSDSFWKAQITQIEMQDDESFVAASLLGNQKIIIGDTSNLNEKLNNLFVFYKNISSEIGWNTYEVYDLRFKGQIITSPSVNQFVPRIISSEKPGSADSNKVKEVLATNIKKKENTKVSPPTPAIPEKPPDKIKVKPETKQSEVNKNNNQQDKRKPKHIFEGIKQ